MSRTKLFALACASVLAIAATMPASAQDAAQENSIPNVFGTQDEAAPAAAPEAPAADAEVDAAPAFPPALPEEAAPTDAASADEVMDAMESAATSEPIVGGVPDPEFLDEYYAKQSEIALKRLDLELARLKSEEAKLNGTVINQNPDGSPEMPAVQVPAEPEDDTSTLPGVSAIMGAKGAYKVELRTAGGGVVTAGVGDMVPGGWKISRIEKNAAYVVSPRTGDEYVLSGATSPEAAAQTGNQRSASQPAPAAAETPVVQQPADSSEGQIIVAPAE